MPHTRKVSPHPYPASSDAIPRGAALDAEWASGPARGAGSASPPTDRVVAVVELVAAGGFPSAAGIADALGLSRSTVGAVLAALQHAQWVVRRADRGFALGPALRDLASGGVHTRAVPGDVSALIEEFGRRLDCGVAVAVSDGEVLRFVEVSADEGVAPGIAPGVAVPLVAPAGIATISCVDEETRERWLATMPARGRMLRAALDDVRRTGCALYGDGALGFDGLEVLTQVLARLSPTADRALSRDVRSLVVDTCGLPYTADRLDVPVDLPVSYATAPIVLPSGDVVGELFAGVLDTAVPPDRRERLARGVTDAAAALGAVWDAC